MSTAACILPADAATDDCAGDELFVLQVIGDSMTPEFQAGEIIVVEPGGLAGDGAYVVAWYRDEWIFRQLRSNAAGWTLHALNPAWPDLPLPDLAAVRGVIIQKALPGRRRASKRYI